jgi:hypothetical protein
MSEEEVATLVLQYEGRIQRTASDGWGTFDTKPYVSYITVDNLRLLLELIQLRERKSLQKSEK